VPQIVIAVSAALPQQHVIGRLMCDACVPVDVRHVV
jgi:hypothetical protein